MLKARLVTLLLAAPLLLALPYPADRSQPNQTQPDQTQLDQLQLDQSQLDQSQPLQRATDKISFDWSKLSNEGLTPESNVSLSYEFCIPATEEHWAEVRSIDPSVEIFPHSKGRIGCRSDQSLCIGNTHQSNWRSILLEIAELAYVERIDRVFWE